MEHFFDDGYDKDMIPQPDPPVWRYVLLILGLLIVSLYLLVTPGKSAELTDGWYKIPQQRCVSRLVVWPVVRTTFNKTEFSGPVRTFWSNNQRVVSYGRQGADFMLQFRFRGFCVDSWRSILVQEQAG